MNCCERQVSGPTPAPNAEYATVDTHVSVTTASAIEKQRNHNVYSGDDELPRTEYTARSVLPQDIEPLITPKHHYDGGQAKPYGRSKDLIGEANRCHTSFSASLRLSYVERSLSGMPRAAATPSRYGRG